MNTYQGNAMRLTRAATTVIIKLYVLIISIGVFWGLTSMVNAQGMSDMEQKYPNVLAVEVRASGNNRFDFDAKISSPYDTPQRYADAFRVMSAEGFVFGVRTLFHDHASEQPFTRDLYSVSIKAGVRSVIVQARDMKYGYGGQTVTVVLPGR